MRWWDERKTGERLSGGGECTSEGVKIGGWVRLLFILLYIPRQREDGGLSVDRETTRLDVVKSM